MEFPKEKFVEPDAQFRHTDNVKDREPVRAIPLPKDKEYEWTKVKTALLVNQPFFAHLLMSQLKIVFTKDLPNIAATDGFAIFINPNTFFPLTLGERIFVLAHEIMHCVWDHCGQTMNWRRMKKVKFKEGGSLPYDDTSHHDLMNIAMDAVINDLLIEGRIGTFKTGAWIHLPQFANKNDEVLEVYRKLWKECERGGKSGKKPKPGDFVLNIPGIGKGFDEHWEPGAEQGENPGEAQQKRNEHEWKVAVEQAASSARAQGAMPAGFGRWIGELMQPKITWAEHIQAFFARKIGSGGYDWRRPDRRLITRDEPIYAPGRSGFGAGCVVVGIDTSGSITPAILDHFFAELCGILEDVRPRRLFIMWCDANVHRVDELEEISDLGWVRSKGAPGGGGTDFNPVFNEIRRLDLEDCDCLVYLTDGMGSFPSVAPNYPVVWGNIYPNSKYPFGEVVDIPVGHL